MQFNVASSAGSSLLLRGALEERGAPREDVMQAASGIGASEPEGAAPEPMIRRLWAAGLTGIPFGVFKVGAGYHLLDVAGPAVGGLVVVWGALDILLNVLAVLFPDRVGYCTLSNLGRLYDLATGQRHRQQVLLAVDTLLAFVIVSYMIWFRQLPTLPAWLGRAWDLAVVLNVLGVGVERVWIEVARRRPPAPSA